MLATGTRTVGRGNLKCPRCHLTYPPPGYARAVWRGADTSRTQFQATCPHCGHTESFGREDATW